MLLQVLLSSALKVGTCPTFGRRHCLASLMHYSGQGRNNKRPYGVGIEAWLVKPFLLVCTRRDFPLSIASGGFFTCFLPIIQCVFKMPLKSLHVVVVWPTMVPTTRKSGKLYTAVGQY